MYKVVLTFESVYGTLKYDHLQGSHRVVHSFAALHDTPYDKMKFEIFFGNINIYLALFSSKKDVVGDGYAKIVVF